MPVSTPPSLARYLTDGKRLVEVVQRSGEGSLCEDVVSGHVLALTNGEIEKHWTPVTPAASSEAA